MAGFVNFSRLVVAVERDGSWRATKGLREIGRGTWTAPTPLVVEVLECTHPDIESRLRETVRSLLEAGSKTS